MVQRLPACVRITPLQSKLSRHDDFSTRSPASGSIIINGVQRFDLDDNVRCPKPWPERPCAGQFLRGVLDKVGVEPQVQRIGAFKSAGDQLLRTDMAPEQREQLQALLDSVYTGFVSSVAEARGKTEEQVCLLR